jgi:hypothetical protein
MERNYWRTLVANWRIWTVPQMVNIFYVPPTYRVLFANCVALVWNIYLARASRQGSTFSHLVVRGQNAKKPYTVKKFSGFPVPSRDVTYQTLPGRE